MKKVIFFLLAGAYMHVSAQLTPGNFPLLNSNSSGPFLFVRCLNSNDKIVVVPGTSSDVIQRIDPGGTMIIVDTLAAGSIPAVDVATGTLVYKQADSLKILFPNGDTRKWENSTSVPVFVGTNSAGKTIVGVLTLTGSYIYYFGSTHSMLWSKPVTGEIRGAFLAGGYVVLTIWDGSQNSGMLEQRNILDGAITLSTPLGVGYEPGAGLLLANGTDIMLSMNTPTDSLNVCIVQSFLSTTNPVVFHQNCKITSFREVGSLIMAVGHSDTPLEDSSSVVWTLSQSGALITSYRNVTNAHPERSCALGSNGEIFSLEYYGNDIDLLTYGTPVPAGIWEHPKFTISVYPNPTTDYWRISDYERGEWQLCNIQGQLLKRGEGEVILAGDLPLGIYLLSLGKARPLKITKI